MVLVTAIRSLACVSPVLRRDISFDLLYVSDSRRGVRVIAQAPRRSVPRLAEKVVIDLLVLDQQIHAECKSAPLAASCTHSLQLPPTEKDNSIGRILTIGTRCGRNQGDVTGSGRGAGMGKPSGRFVRIT